VLLLTTTGRKSGLPRTTPLPYEEVDGATCVVAARGRKADWFRNVIAHPQVEVRIKSRRFQGIALPVTDPVRIPDILLLRLQRHPTTVGAILRSAGFPSAPNRAELEAYAAGLAMTVIRPHEQRRGQTLMRRIKPLLVA